MKQPIDKRFELISAFLRKEVTKTAAAHLLGCTTRTIENYALAVREKGRDGLIDHRHSNHIKLKESEIEKLLALKRQDPWRSARNLKDTLSLPVGEVAIWKRLKKAGLVKLNRERVKPLIRFEAEYPNDLWQTDIMGKIDLSYLGSCYLIATLDDHSRFCPAGRWFKTQGKMNVFRIWHESLEHWGLPKAMLQDEGSQYKARTRFGATDYQWYADLLKINLLWARRAQTKGKIERFWRFVQDDFVRSALKVKSFGELNYQFRAWLSFYNYRFKSRYFGNVTHASRYHASSRRISRVELQSLLTIEERRKVTRESTISLYGQHYYVPPGYIGCRIWVKIIKNRLFLEANGEVFWQTRLQA